MDPTLREPQASKFHADGVIMNSTTPDSTVPRTGSIEIDIEKAVFHSAEPGRSSPSASLAKRDSNVDNGHEVDEDEDEGESHDHDHDHDHDHGRSHLAIRPDLTHVPSHVSHHELEPVTTVESNTWQYTRFSPTRKVVITTVVSVCSFLAPMSSTAILSAIPEVAEEYGTTGTIVNISNALYMLFMGISPCFYGPVSGVYGRRWVGQPSFSRPIPPQSPVG